MSCEHNTYRFLIEIMNDVVWTMDSNLNMTFISPSCRKVFGLTPEERMQQKFNEIMTPASLGYVMQMFNEEIKREKAGLNEPDRILKLDIEYSCKDSTTIWMETLIQAVRDPSGEITGYQGVCRDITERRIVEERLQFNLDLLRIAGETANFGGWSVDLSTNNVVWSDQVALIHDMPIGYPPSVSEGISFYAPEWRDKITEVFTACAEKGISYDEEMEIITAKGRRVWVRTIGEAVKDKVGDIAMVQGSFQDITENHILAEKIKKEHEQLLIIFNSIDEMIYISDPVTYRVLYVNRKLADVLKKDPVGGLCYQEFQGFDSPCEFCSNEIIIKNKPEPYFWEFLNPKLKKHFKLYDRIINWTDGRDVRFEMAVDITDLKQAEDKIRKLNKELEQRVKERTFQLEAVNKELEAFAYSVSHDLRTPLRALDGFSANLINTYADQLDEQGKHYLNRIQNATHNMGNLINDLLKLSRVTRAELKLQKVSISQLAGEIIRELQEAEPERLVEVKVTPELSARGDLSLIRVVMENLLGNAWKFSGKQSRAKIEVGVTRQNGEEIYFVRDNGAGFNMDYAGKLFGAFQRLHGTGEFSGTGVGLATVQRIINRHGGKVWAEGEVGMGATFYFTLPG